MSTVSNMFNMARTSHAGQKDMAGKDYFWHPYTVALDVEKLYNDDDELTMIALGHDLIEDTSVTVFDLIDAGFSERFVNGIDSLTRREYENYNQYALRLKCNADAVKVKLADLRHNMDMCRLIVVTEEDCQRQEKYAKVYAELSDLLKQIKGE
jgi:GTP diphosphokinase / guanosine-3',5'-bis(diphosphate) 3'-diphosphatase